MRHRLGRSGALLFTTLALLLSACGGGGSSAASPTPPAPPVTTITLTVDAAPSQACGGTGSAGIVIAGTSTTLVNTVVLNETIETGSASAADLTNDQGFSLWVDDASMPDAAN